MSNDASGELIKRVRDLEVKLELTIDVVVEQMTDQTKRVSELEQQYEQLLKSK